LDAYEIKTRPSRKQRNR